MKKLFRGKFRGVPAAMLAVILLGVLVAGGVVAAASGYTLWQGTSTITVVESVSIYYGNDMESCNKKLVPGALSTAILSPGVRWDTWFKITNDASHDLLIRAEVTTSDDTAVTVAFYDEGDNPSDIGGSGLPISSLDGEVFVCRRVCVNGTAAPAPPADLYTVSTTFTRESPPAP